MCSAVSLIVTLQEMVLHALFENGQLGTADIEAHIKDDIEREDVKIREMSRRMRQGYKEVVSGFLGLDSVRGSRADVADHGTRH